MLVCREEPCEVVRRFGVISGDMRKSHFSNRLLAQIIDNGFDSLLRWKYCHANSALEGLTMNKGVLWWVN